MIRGLRLLSNEKKEQAELNNAPGPVSKKKTRPYSKRGFFIAIVLITISLFLILTGGNALSQKPANRNNAAQQDNLPKYTVSEPVLNWENDTVSDSSASDTQKSPEVPNYNAQPVVVERALDKAPLTRPVDRQWIEHQRMAYLSRSMIQDWPIAVPTNNADVAAQGYQATAAQSASINNYLDQLMGSQAGKAPGQSQQEFFEKNMSAPGDLSSTRQPQKAPYKIPAGTMIPCAIITGINSDLPGNITAQVSENVYDFVSPYVCLIPQGSRVFGTYASTVDFGQRRIQIRWTSVTYPDGSSLNLEGMPGVDKKGYSGLHDKYYPHYGRMLTAAILTSTLILLPDLILDEITSSSSGGTTVTVNTGDNQNSTKAELAKAAGEAMADMGKKVFDKNLNVQPTIQIRPGTRFNIQVNADILFNTAWQ